MSEKKYSAPALEKGLDIIELLSREEFGLSQVEIARNLDRSVSEIFRMIVVLQDRGYVMLDPHSDKYMLTTFLFEVAHRTPLVKRLTSLAGPSMRRMTVKINQSAHLTILSSDHVLVIGQVDSPGDNVMSVRLGAKIGIWRASSGRVILAYLPNEALLETIDKAPLPSDMSLKGIQQELTQIRTIGHEVMDSYVVSGIVNISAPIIDHSGLAIAALTVPHIKRLDDTTSFNDCVSSLLEVTKSLSASLGGDAAAEVLR